MVQMECSTNYLVEPASDNPRNQVCDRCKDRKTKCDRGSPCFPCQTAGVPCRVTRTKPEKRQRIVISAKYNETLESVDNRLQEVLDAVHELQVSGASRTASEEHLRPALQHASDFPRGFIGTNLPSTASISYRGESSFESQIQRTLNIHGGFVGSQVDGMMGADSNAQHILNWASTSQENSWKNGTSGQLPLLEEYPRLAKHKLPPSDAVLRLLRLTQTEKQRFFVDVDLFDEQQFTEQCRNVFFAINPYSIWAWSIVNVGLFYLFVGLSPDRYNELGLDAHQVDMITDTLASNAQAAVNSFQMCHEPSTEGCQALALSATFCMKSGQISKAWSLLSATARMCMDLGFHRSRPGTADLDQFQSRKVFWYIFVMEKGVALTLGRPPNLRISDITVDTADYMNEILGVPGKVAIAFYELASIEEEMLAQLFGPSSRQVAAETRQAAAKAFHQRLKDAQKRMSADDGFSGFPYPGASELVDFLLHSVATVVCSSTSASQSPSAVGIDSHFCTACVDDARQALQILCNTTEIGSSSPSKGNGMFLNIILCLSPFTPYLVLAAYTAAERSVADFQLLSSVNSILESVAETSPLARDTLKLCMKLYQHVQTVVVGSRGLESRPTMDVGQRVDTPINLAPERCLTISSGTTAAGSPFSDWQVEHNS